jgi:hypothetical protein
MEGQRRRILRAIVLGAAGGSLLPLSAWADRIRILGGEGPAAGGIAVGPGRSELRRFLAAVWVGESRGAGPLRVFWLHGASGLPLDVLTLDEARASGVLVVTEQDQATVLEIAVENRGKSPVLLLAGEILLGGKQNRVLTTDVLVPPLSGRLAIGVYCVEQGRWAGTSAGFSSAGSFAAPGLRAKLTERAPQASIWAEVHRYASRALAASPTRSYQAIYDKPEVKAHLADVERRIEASAPANALGAAVWADERFLGLDLFNDPGLFARAWPKLFRAQALEILGREPGAEEEAPRQRSRVAELLRAAAGAQGVTRGGPGAGELFEFRATGQRGAALLFEGRPLHLAVL